MNDDVDEELFVPLLDKERVPWIDDALEPNPIELNIPSSKEFDELFNELFDEEYDISWLLLNILELLFFPKLKKTQNIKFRIIELFFFYRINNMLLAWLIHLNS